VTRCALKTIVSVSLLALVCLAGISCVRERVSEREPIHLNPNMDDQPKYKAQSSSEFFDDGSAMRRPVEGTVARGDLRDDVAYFTGKDGFGTFIAHMPTAITKASLKRGRERFDIYCAPCHGRVGDGRGIMIQYQYAPPPSFHNERVRRMSDGEVFDIVTNGVRNMPSYKHQLPVDDRWAIIGYLRALQRSQNATLDDLPEQIQDSLKQVEQP